MRLALALGAAAVATAAALSAPQSGAAASIVISHGGPGLAIDTDRDGWVTRAEAAAAADRMFDEMDSNDDGRLTGADEPALPDIDVDIPEIEVLEGEDGEDVHVRVIRRGVDSDRIEREVERAMREAERAGNEAERAMREVERAGNEAERAAREAIRHREVVVIHAGPGSASAAVAPRAPIPPRPPMFMMMVASSEEADRNGDGALSRDEFRAQQLRFFDASDANGDGRVRFDPPQPPEPPAPPAPPEPPR